MLNEGIINETFESSVENLGRIFEEASALRKTHFSNNI
jgi:hypothetical protein